MYSSLKVYENKASRQYFPKYGFHAKPPDKINSYDQDAEVGEILRWVCLLGVGSKCFKTVIVTTRMVESEGRDFFSIRERNSFNSEPSQMDSTVRYTVLRSSQLFYDAHLIIFTCTSSFKNVWAVPILVKAHKNLKTIYNS